MLHRWSCVCHIASHQEVHDMFMSYLEWCRLIRGFRQNGRMSLREVLSTKGNLILPAKLIIMAGEGINEDYPVEIHEYLSTFENSIGAVDEMLKTMMSVSRNELLQKLDPLEQAKVDLVSAYTLNSMFWVYLATQGVNPKEHPVKQELERIRVYMNRVKEITDKKKAGKLDRGAASRFVKNALWEPKPKNASKVANKGKSKN
uniref:Nuclear nucleic acid-binding protein C1D n=1 Tax=Bos taurus TaxID=9913 RepID=A0AAA9SCY7_BOVIN